MPDVLQTKLLHQMVFELVQTQIFKINCRHLLIYLDVSVFNFQCFFCLIQICNISFLIKNVYPLYNKKIIL